MAKILLVEDDNIIRYTFTGFLEDKGHFVVAVEDGRYALEALKEESNFDLILAEIELPRMPGHVLLRQVGENYPHIKQMLLTEHGIENFISIASQFGFSNIITKTIPMNFDDILTYMEGLLDGKCFGVRGYMNEEHEYFELDVLNSDDIVVHIHNILEKFEIEDEEGKLEEAFVKVLTNAVHYGILGADGAQKKDWEQGVAVPPGQVIVECGKDEEKLAVAIFDSAGRLEKKHILRGLSRQIRKDKAGAPIDVSNTSGKGMFISRKNMDRVIVNIEKNKRTEVICIKYLNQIPIGPKPLLINEI